MRGNKKSQSKPLDLFPQVCVDILSCAEFGIGFCVLYEAWCCACVNDTQVSKCVMQTPTKYFNLSAFSPHRKNKIKIKASLLPSTLLCQLFPIILSLTCARLHGHIYQKQCAVNASLCLENKWFQFSSFNRHLCTWSKAAYRTDRLQNR